MEEGLIFALLAAVCFGGSQVFVRRGVFQTGESISVVFITVFVGVLLFSIVLLITGDWDRIWSLSWQGLVLLGAAGISHFVIGRFLSYNCVRLMGANKASAFTRTSLFYAVGFGIIFLNEPLTTFVILGVLSIVTGTTLVGIEKKGNISGLQGKGILYGLGGALGWGTSGVLIKAAMPEIGSPFAAAFISYTAACLLIAGPLVSKRQRKPLAQLHRQSLIHLALAGVFVGLAQLFRYVALSYSPVSLVQPLVGTNSLFVLIFSFLLNRNIEVFTWKIFAGIAVIILGAFFIFW